MRETTLMSRRFWSLVVNIKIYVYEQLRDFEGTAVSFGEHVELGTDWVYFNVSWVVGVVFDFYNRLQGARGMCWFLLQLLALMWYLWIWNEGFDGIPPYRY